MPELVITAVITPCVSAVVAAIVGGLVASVRRASSEEQAQRAEDKAEIEAMKEGIKSLLRGEIMHLHHERVRRGSTTTVEKEVMQRDFEAYAGLKGNGVVRTLYAEFMELPTIDD